MWTDILIPTLMVNITRSITCNGRCNYALLRNVPKEGMNK